MARWYVLVIKGHHVQAVRELKQGLEILVVTYRGGGNCGHGRNVLCLSQDT
jgi:hypothetical protein